MNKYTKYLLEIGTSTINGTFRISRKYCPACETKTFFLITGRESRSIRCLRCRSTAISLATIAELKKIPLKTNCFAYELSYHGAVFTYLRNRFVNFFYSEYFGPATIERYVNGIRNEDVQKLSFDNCLFDLVTSTEVFEHVPDYMTGFSEIFRVLKKDGYFVFTVPLFNDEHTKAICSIAVDGSLNWSGHPEYHDSNVTGVGTVPVFWHHSLKQITLDLKKVGFSHASVTKSNIYAQSVVQHVIVAKK